MISEKEKAETNNQSYVGITDLVSIVMPAYNCAEYIAETIESVIKQTYEKWELIIVDDNSTDNTSSVVKNYMKNSHRIKYYKLNKNSGAATARNFALKKCEGQYIAFLDSDDLWFDTKLEEQLEFLKINQYTFTCTYYDKIDKYSNKLNYIIEYPFKVSYQELLYNCPGNSTVIYDANAIEEKIHILPIKKRNDYVMWLQVIKKAKYLNCLEKPLSSHRLREGSLSNKKIDLVKYHWMIYREIENLSISMSLKLTTFWIYKTLLNKLKK